MDIIMRLIIYFIALTTTMLLFTISCKKESEMTNYSNVKTVAEKKDSINPEAEYSYGGIIPISTSSNNNKLYKTKWILRKYVSGFSTEYPNDTIEFINNNEYKINNSGLIRTYVLSKATSTTNYDLQLNYFSSIGGSHYYGQVGYYFVEDGEINGITFVDVYKESIKIKIWMVKI